MNAEIIFDKRLNTHFSIGSIDVSTIPTSHPGGGLGYRFCEGEKSFVFLTDNELMHDHPGSRRFKGYLEFCAGADLLFHDAEYTQDEYNSRKAWGHSSVPQVIDLGIKAKVKQLGLFHLAQDRTDDQMDTSVSDSQGIIDSVGTSMECFAVSCGWQTCL